MQIIFKLLAYKTKYQHIFWWPVLNLLRVFILPYTYNLCLTKENNTFTHKTIYCTIKSPQKNLLIQIKRLFYIIRNDLTSAGVGHPQWSLHLLHTIKFTPVGVRSSIGGAHRGVQSGAETPWTVVFFCGESCRCKSGDSNHNEKCSHIGSWCARWRIVSHWTRKMLLQFICSPYLVLSRYRKVYFRFSVFVWLVDIKSSGWF